MSADNRLSINMRTLISVVRSGTLAAMSDVEVRVLMVYLSAGDTGDGGSFYGTSTVAKYAGRCTRAVKAANAKLAARGIIDRSATRGGNPRSDVATTTIRPVHGDAPVNPDAPVNASAPDRCTTVHPTGAPGCTPPVNHGAPKRTSRRDKVKGPEKGPAVPESLSSSPAFTSAWASWQTYLREKRKTPTPSTIKAQLAKCEKWGAAAAVEAIQASISNGWQGLFEPKGNHGSNGRHVRTAAERGEFPETIDLSRVTLNPGAA